MVHYKPLGGGTGHTIRVCCQKGCAGNFTGDLPELENECPVKSGGGKPSELWNSLFFFKNLLFLVVPSLEKGGAAFG